jgi:hypothetical protein
MIRCKNISGQGRVQVIRQQLSMAFPLLIVLTRVAIADTSPSAIATVSGQIDYFMTGVPLAIDTDANNRADVFSLPASFTVNTGDIAVGAELESAYLYWGGTQSEGSGADANVTLVVPGVSVAGVTADVCYSSDGGAASYDMHLCRANVTSLLSSGSLIGTYSVDGYSGLIADGAIDNASASLVIIYSAPGLLQSDVIVYDGLLTMSSSMQNLNLSGFTAYSIPAATLTWYGLEGDTAGSGTEQVVITGNPGASSVTFPDMMDHTINTTVPPQTDTIGVDIDRQDITAALTPGDISLDIDFSAGTDKWWLGVNVVQVAKAYVDTQPTQLINLSGQIDYFMTGTPLALDTNTNGRVDSLSLPASFSVTSSDVTAGGILEQAYLFWAGTRNESIGPDSQITLTAPGGSATPVTADICYSTDGGSTSYDLHLCRANVTSLVSVGSMIGTYFVDGYSGLIADGSVDNASASLLIAYKDNIFPHGNVYIHEGLQTMVNNSINIGLSGSTIDSPPSGTLTWYGLDGDTAGSGTEQVVITGNPGASSVTFPNMMDHTINTTAPPQTDTFGVDIDRQDITAALTAGDTSLDIDFSAGTDKWWLGANVTYISSVAFDSDSDGILDGAEDYNGNGLIDAGETNPFDFDSDDDGLTDYFEVNVIGTDPNSSTTVLSGPVGDMNDDGIVGLADLLQLQQELTSP